MNQKELNKILDLHELWLEDYSKGEYANLSYQNLSGLNLSHRNLTDANCIGTNFTDAYLKGAIITGADLRCANFTRADLRSVISTRAHLDDAIFDGTNMDYSSFPLWCGSFGIKADDQLVAQLIYHVMRLEYTGNDPKIKRLMKLKTLKDVANCFHLVDDCGEIK